MLLLVSSLVTMPNHKDVWLGKSSLLVSAGGAEARRVRGALLRDGQRRVARPPRH